MRKILSMGESSTFLSITLIFQDISSTRRPHYHTYEDRWVSAIAIYTRSSIVGYDVGGGSGMAASPVS
jgi:hypothetical protein